MIYLHIAALMIVPHIVGAMMGCWHHRCWRNSFEYWAWQNDLKYGRGNWGASKRRRSLWMLSRPPRRPSIAAWR